MYHLKTLELPIILEKLAQFAVSNPAKTTILKLHPLYDRAGILHRLREVDEARLIINQHRSLPLNTMEQLEKALAQLEKEPILTPAMLDAIASFLEDATKLKFALNRHLEECPTVASYGNSINPLQALKEAIRTAIYGDQIQDQASSLLARLRKKITTTEGQIKDKLQGIMKTHGQYMMDVLIVQRNGRYAVPIKAEHKRSIEGDILDKSATGQTLYIEPKSVQHMTHQLQLLKIDEEAECYRLLAELTNLCAQHEREIRLNQETMVHCDVLFAKGRLSYSMNGCSPSLSEEYHLSLINGRHPLLFEPVVPLTITLGMPHRGLLITGPNTGGKTVAMKTVGLLALMCQCGLHIPCDKGTSFPVFQNVLADIGDGQSISQNLSTFSSHITEINQILTYANAHSLVLLDEIGSGTEPSEGSGLARAILEYLSTKDCLIMSSTHFSELKIFAEEHPKFVNASMCFDASTLKPLYRMEQGKSGKSHALHIAYRLGMDPSIIDRAHLITYGDCFDASLFQANATGMEELSKNQSHTIKEPVAKALHKDIYRKNHFNLGDSVWIHTLSTSGTVVTTINQRGEYTVLVNGVKYTLNHKRLKPYIDSKKLYPDDYDMRIVTDTVYERKKEKLLSKGKHKKLEMLKNKA